MGFPQVRARRTRQSEQWRRMVRETHLRPEALIYGIVQLQNKIRRTNTTGTIIATTGAPAHS